MPRSRSLVSCSCGEEAYDEGWEDGYQEGLQKGRQEGRLEPGRAPAESYAERHWVTSAEIEDAWETIRAVRAAKAAARQARRLPALPDLLQVPGGAEAGVTPDWPVALQRALAAAQASGVRHWVARTQTGSWYYSWRPAREEYKWRGGTRTATAS